MTRLAVLEDNTHDMTQLKAALASATEDDTSWHVEYFTCAESLLHKLQQTRYDIYLLDIIMDGGPLGMDVAEAIRELDELAAIVFLTGYANFVFKGYHYKAHDYILKPVTAERLKTTLTRVVKDINKAACLSPTRTIKSCKGPTYRVQIDEIIYIESHGRKLMWHVVGGKTITAYGKLEEQKAELLPYGFLQIHKSFLVNISYVSHLDGTKDSVILSDGESLRYSRNYKDSLFKGLARWSVRQVR